MKFFINKTASIKLLLYLFHAKSIHWTSFVMSLSSPKNLKKKTMRQARMPTRVHLTNILKDIEAEDLVEVLAPIKGFVSATVPLYFGKSRGYAILTFESKKTAINFIKDYQRVMLDGQPMLLELEVFNK